MEGGFVVLIPAFHDASAFVLPIDAHSFVWEDLCGNNDFERYACSDVEAIILDNVIERGYNDDAVCFLNSYEFCGWDSRPIYQDVLIVQCGLKPLTFKQAHKVKTLVLEKKRRRCPIKKVFR